MEGLDSPQQSRAVNWQTPDGRCSALARPGIHSTNAASPPTSGDRSCGGPEGLAGLCSGEKYVSCNSCGQASQDLRMCDFCGKIFDGNVKVRRKYVPQHPKRKLDLGPSTVSLNSSSASPVKLQSSPPECKMSKQTFYGRGTATAGGAFHLSSGTNGQSVHVIVHPTSTTLSLGLLSATVPAPRKPGRRPRKEPECLTISSDEEAEVECQSDAKEDKQVFTSRSCPGNNAHGKENLVVGHELTGVPNNKAPLHSAPPVHRRSLPEAAKPQRSGHESRAIVPGAAALQHLRFRCRSIRVGSHKVSGRDYWVEASQQGFEFSIRTVEPNDDTEVAIQLRTTDITKVMAHLARSMTVLYVCTTSQCGNIVREKLRMTRKTQCIYDPESTDDREKLITFLPDPALMDDEKNFLRTVFPGPLLHEISQVLANEILIKSSPSTMNNLVPVGSGMSSGSPAPTAQQQQQPVTTQITHVVFQNVPVNTTVVTRTRTAPASPGSMQVSSTTEQPSEPNISLLVYPPPPQTGGIPVYSADFMCLGETQFLNDVIIDFYLKYLLREKVSQEVRERTHVFSSFFYPRLTQRQNSRGPGMARLSAAARRHRNVRTWTRHVDIFEKDYIVVPINQNSHWFLAIVCFPGLVARCSPPQAMPQSDDVPTSAEHSPMSPGPPSTPECKTDGSQEESESLMDSEPDEAAMDTDDSENPIPKCADVPENAYILVLDSLRGGGANKCRIMSTLREYLTEEWKAKKQSQLLFCHANMKGYTPMTPQQGNYSDCGIYLLQYVESFLEDPPRDGELVKLELSDWFPEDRVAQKRCAIQDLILRLHLEQHPDSDFPARWQRQEEQRIKALQASAAASPPLVITGTPPKPLGANTILLLCTTPSALS